MRMTFTCPECFHKAPRGAFLWFNLDEVECPACGEAFGTRFIDQVHDGIYRLQVRNHRWLGLRQIKAGKVLSHEELKQLLTERATCQEKGVRLSTFLLIVAGAGTLLILLLPIPLLIPMIAPGGMP